MKTRKTIQLLLASLFALLSVTSVPAQGFPSKLQSPDDENYPLFLPVIFLPRVANIFGVETNNYTSANFQTALNADVYWVRSAFFDWASIESVRGVYDWSKVNEYGILLTSKNQMQIIANIKYTPSWAQKYPGVSCGPIKDTRLKDFGNFVTALVTKYSAPPYNIHYWEFFNEPDVDHAGVDPNNLFGCWGEPSNKFFGGEYFSEMLKVAYKSVKAVNPSDKVIIGGLLLDCDPDVPPPPGKSCKSGRFFEGILLNGAGTNFDYVGFHSYVYTKDNYQKIWDEDHPNWDERGGQIVGKVNFLREKMGNAGISKPLFMTELAMVAGGNDNDCWTANSSFEELQADLVVSSYARNWGLGLIGQVWYTLDNGWRWSGLQCQGVQKPAYYALSFMSKELKDAVAGNPITQYPGLRGYEFHLKTKDVQLLWTPDGFTTVNIPVPVGVSKIYDIFGTEISPIPENIAITHPTYLETAK